MKLYNLIKKDLKKLGKISTSTYDEIQRQSKIINNRFEVLERRGIEGKSMAYRYAQYELETQTPRYEETKRELRSIPVEEMLERSIDIERKYMSNTSKYTGLKKISKDRYNKMSDRFDEFDEEGKHTNRFRDNISVDMLDDFFDSGGGALLENGFLDSYQIIEDWLASVIVEKNDFEKFQKTLIEHNQKADFNYNEYRRDLKELKYKRIPRKLKKKRKKQK